MNKTKFTKVAVEDRLPDASGRYFVWVDNPNAISQENAEQYNMEKKVFDAFNREFNSFYDVTHWLKESPDREEEMIEMLEKLTSAFEVEELESYQRSRISDAKSLLKSLKQEK